MSKPVTCSHCSFVAHLPDDWKQPGFKCPKCLKPTRLPRPEPTTAALELEDDPDPAMPPPLRSPQDRQWGRQLRRALFCTVAGLGAAFLILLVFSVAWRAVSGDQRERGRPLVMAPTQEVNSRPVATPDPPAKKRSQWGWSGVDSGRLVTDYESNELAADKKYKGSTIKIEGVAKEIGSDAFKGLPYVDLRPWEYKGADILPPIRAYFSPGTAGTLTELKRGSAVTVVGLCEGKSSYHVVLTDCALQD